MKRIFYDSGTQWLQLVVIVLIGVLSLCRSPAWGYDVSGLSVRLYADQNHPNFKFALGQEPVGLIAVISNTGGEPVVTERGFSLLEFHHSLIITDPGGVQHILRPKQDAHKMPQPFFLNDRPWGLAEVLEPGWIRSVTISDLSDQLPAMRTTPGWYTIQAHLPFVRFAGTGRDAGLGLLGLQDHPENWYGTITSNVLQFFIAPPAGAQLEVQLLDMTNNPSKPLAQVPVRIFRQADIPADYDLATAWQKIEPIITGATDPEGWTVWNETSSCLVNDDYAIVAYHLNEFQSDFLSNDDDGWLPDCAGLFAKTILFSQSPPMVADSWAVFGLSSVQIGKHAVIYSGDIGANEASDESKHKSSVNVKIEENAELKEGVRIYADSVKIEKEAVVYDVYYNELENKGQILGAMVTPLELPVWELPAFLEAVPGQEDIKVKSKKHKKDKKDKKGKKDREDQNVVELTAGAYDEVKIEKYGELHLLGGTYHFRKLKLYKDAELICLGPATILIQEDLEGENEVYIGPEEDSAVSAADIVFYVGGIEDMKGKKKQPKPKYKNVTIGKKGLVRANIYAPNSTLKIEKESELQGSFIAKEIIVDDKTTIEYKGAF